MSNAFRHAITIKAQISYMGTIVQQCHKNESLITLELRLREWRGGLVYKTGQLPKNGKYIKRGRPGTINLSLKKQAHAEAVKWVIDQIRGVETTGHLVQLIKERQSELRREYPKAVEAAKNDIRNEAV